MTTPALTKLVNGINEVDELGKIAEDGDVDEVDEIGVGNKDGDVGEVNEVVKSDCL